jgi:hypothetical protein
MQSNAARQIDPIDLDLQECRASFETFLDRHVWIEDKVTHQAIRLQLWPEQRRVIPGFLASDKDLFLKAHQLGFTWIFVAAFGVWCSVFKPLHQFVVNSFNEDAGGEIMDRARFIRDRLPREWEIQIGKDNSEVQEYLHRDLAGHSVNSEMKVIPATEKGGQGKTPNVMIFDESCWNRYIERAFNSSIPGLTQAKGKVIVISNAIKTAPGWPFTRSLAVGALHGQNDFHLVFLPWWANPGRSRGIVRGEGGSPILDARGQPMTEFKAAMLRSGGTNGGMMTEEDFQQRFPESIDEAISTLGGSYFGNTLKRHSYACRGIVGHLQRDKEKQIQFVQDPRGPLEVWRWPYYLVDGWDSSVHWARRYCVGSDVSEGLGASYSVGYVMDRERDEIVARLRSNRVDAYQWADMLALLAEWYCSCRDWTRLGGVTRETALICAENTGAGQTTVKRLKDLGASQYLRMIEGQQGGGHTTIYGWSENQQAKQDLSEDLRTWFRMMKGTLYDAILVDESSTWIKHEGSMKLGPEEGHFGDCVIAAGCTIQASHFIGRGPERVKAPDMGYMAKYVEKQGQLTGWTA